MNQENFNKNSKYNDTNPLYFAAAYDRIEIFKYLLEQKIFSINSKVDDVLLFEYVIEKRKYEIAEILIRQPKIITIGSCSYGSIKIEEFKLVRKSVHFRYLSSDSYTMEYDVFALNLLSFFLMDPIDKENADQINERKKQVVSANTGMFGCLAAKYLKASDFVQFLDNYEIDINSIERKFVFFFNFFNKITPIFSCIYNIGSDIMKVILTKYKDVVDINHKMQKGITALHVLCKIKSNLREGDKMFLSMKNLKINEKETNCKLAPLHVAILCNHLETVAELLDNPSIDVNIQDNLKNTPLHYAFQFKTYISPSESVQLDDHIEILKLLLHSSKRKANVMLKNSEFRLPIQLFILNNNYKAPVHSNDNLANEIYSKYISILELFVQNKLNAALKKQINKWLPAKIIKDSKILTKELLEESS